MTVEFKLPDIGEGVVEGEIVAWLVKKGEFLAEDQPMVEVMTDKATVEIPSPAEGKVLETRGEAGDIVAVGDVLVIIESVEASGADPVQEEKQAAEPTAQVEAVEKTEAEPTPSPPSKQAERPAKVLATPAVRKAARERGIDLNRLQGTGRGGRITLDDLEGAVAAPSRPSEERSPEVTKEATREVETLPYRGLRKKIGDRMSQSKLTAAHFTYVEEVDATELASLRKRFLERSPGERLTFLPFIVKAVVAGLRKFRSLNATLDETRGELILKKYYNIGIATATENGLIVPVVKAADRKSVLEIGQEISALAEAARAGKAKLDDLQDSTFTITSLGALGGILATPIINYPEVAILGVHKIKETPVVREGEIVIRNLMNLSLSLDHRVVDGHVGAEFMQVIIRYLEDPGLLLLESR